MHWLDAGNGSDLHVGTNLKSKIGEVLPLLLCYTVACTERSAQSKGAVALFMKLVGTPADQIEGMRHAPIWPMFEAIAPTLAYDHTAILGEDGSVPIERAARVSVPTLVMNGGASYAFMYETARALSKAMPHAQLRTLEGQMHDVDPKVLALVLVEFFTE
jgi:pimeloyl-ACP methyl ester carboxylesterase